MAKGRRPAAAEPGNLSLMRTLVREGASGSILPVVLNLWLLSAAYPGLYDFLEMQFLKGEPAISLVYDVYQRDGKLIYVRDSCESEYTYAKFFVHIYPVDITAGRRDGLVQLSFRHNRAPPYVILDRTSHPAKV